jgi:hypothetical protein
VIGALDQAVGAQRAERLEDARFAHLEQVAELDRREGAAAQPLENRAAQRADSFDRAPAYDVADPVYES